MNPLLELPRSDDNGRDIIPNFREILGALAHNPKICVDLDIIAGSHTLVKAAARSSTQGRLIIYYKPPFGHYCPSRDFYTAPRRNSVPTANHKSARPQPYSNRFCAPCSPREKIHSRPIAAAICMYEKTRVKGLARICPAAPARPGIKAESEESVQRASADCLRDIVSQRAF